MASDGKYALFSSVYYFLELGAESDFDVTDDELPMLSGSDSTELLIIKDSDLGMLYTVGRRSQVIGVITNYLI